MRVAQLWTQSRAWPARHKERLVLFFRITLSIRARRHRGARNNEAAHA
jgi:hypothetical protein